MWRELGVDPLLLHIERSQMRWFGHQIFPPGSVASATLSQINVKIIYGRKCAILVLHLSTLSRFYGFSFTQTAFHTTLPYRDTVYV